MFKTLCESGDTTLLLLSLGLSLLSVLIGFWFGYFSRVKSNQAKAREEAVHAFINEIQAELLSISQQQRPKDQTNIDAIRSIHISYENVKRHLKPNKREILQIYWERYIAQIADRFDNESDREDFGYRNYLTASTRLSQLKTEAEIKWA